jgi:hypothetical protein
LVCSCEKDTPLKTLKKGKAVKKPLPRKLSKNRKPICENSDIQRGLPAQLEIKRGKFGLGAFAVNGIRGGTFIGEYVGELVPTKSIEKEYAFLICVLETQEDWIGRLEF